MSRPLIALIAIASLPAAARADTPTCEAESKAVNADEKANGRDPAMRSPTDRRAKKHMTDGTAHHREGLAKSRVVGTDEAAAEAFRSAIKEYEAGALIDPAGLLLYNLAQSYRALGDYEHAIDQYRRILDNVRPREPVRRLIECHVANMVAEQERAARTAPPRDAVPTDPDPPDNSPEIRETVANPTQPTAAPVDLQLGAEAPHAEPWYADGLGWGVFGTGVVSAGVGGFFLFDARRLDDDADREDRDDVRLDLRAQADQHRNYGTIATVAGGVFVVAGIVKLAIAPKGRTRLTSASLTVAPDAIVLVGRFY